MPKTLKGIIVRIVVVATTKTDANSVPRVPACSVRCEVSIGINQFFKEWADFAVVFQRAPDIIMCGGRLWYTAEKRGFVRGYSANRPKIPQCSGPASKALPS